MNKLCCVLYGASDKSAVEYRDVRNVRLIYCKNSKAGLFAGRKIRKLCGDIPTLDSEGYAKNILVPLKKALFKRDIGEIVRIYADRYGLDFFNSEITVAGKVDNKSLSIFSDMFKMVWIYNGDTSCDFYNVYSVKDWRSIPKSDVAVFTDCSCPLPESGLVFNLTEKDMDAVNDIQIRLNDIRCPDTALLCEVARLSGMSYEITNFIK